MAALLERLRHAAPTEAWDNLAAGAGERLERFAAACPLYARTLAANPRLALDLESTATRETPIGPHTLVTDAELAQLEARQPGFGRSSPGYPGFLRRFRRRISLRIAYRDVSGFAATDLIVEELTRLAEMIIGECTLIATGKTTERWGEPWDEERNAAARFTILGLGKLGGRELNFSSDVDLIYVYEGEGHTRRRGARTSTTNAEYFQRLGEQITRLLNEKDGDGFLFRTDLRLRPGGPAAPLVVSLATAENYYAGAGQSWERLALLKARTVAGDFVTGGELLESLQSFRYPRHPPASLLAEVAAMKLRTEREVVGAGALTRDLKSGYGGIREIEFLTQVLQLLHAARFPFLQTHATAEALHQLARYDLLTADDARFLLETYWWLRRIENRLQMAEEQQTHDLPPTASARAALARTLGCDDPKAFEDDLTVRRQRVRQLYSRLFASEDPNVADPADTWWSFFAEQHIQPAVRARLAAWFEDAVPEASARTLRLFVRGEETWPLVREQVQRFAGLVPALDRILPQLARPERTLTQIAAFAERYGSRNQFLAACTLNPEFFEVLALLFDRSRFIADLLTRHPEIFDEVLRPEILRKRKEPATRRREIATALGPDANDLGPRLWLYVRAEQVRTAIGHLLGFLPEDEVGAELTALAEAALAELIARTPGAEKLVFVALGTFGGGELSFGSDLDLVVVGETGGPNEQHAIRTLQRHLIGEARDPTYVIDLRLRPHGDAGPLISTLAAYQEYFATSAQIWERQVLTRARVIAGPVAAVAAWQSWCDATTYAGPLAPDAAAALWRMRLRVERERGGVQPPERAFKTAAGGLVDLEFASQILRLHHGGAYPLVRVPQTRRAWTRLAEAGLVAASDVERLLENHRHLQRVEWCLRRDANRGVNVLPEAADDQRAVARWLGSRDWPEFWSEHCQRLRETRAIVIRVLQGVVPSTTLETGR